MLKEVQHATAELDYILEYLYEEKKFLNDRKERDSQHQQDIEILESINKVLKAQQKSNHSELTLTLVVESVAIPYYLNAFFNHAYHLPTTTSAPISLTVAIAAVAYTVFKFNQK